jgi:hypothetical protein
MEKIPLSNLPFHFTWPTKIFRKFSLVFLRWPSFGVNAVAERLRVHNSPRQLRHNAVAVGTVRRSGLPAE